MDKFKVIFTGTLKPGVDQGEFIDTFSSRFKVSKEKALLMLSAGKPVTIKKDLDAEQAAKYVKVLDAMGMVVKQKPMIAEGLSLVPLDEEKEDSDTPDGETCPKCGSTRIENDNCLGCGIVVSKYLQWAEENPDQAAAPTPVPEPAAAASSSEHPVSDTPVPPPPPSAAATPGEQNPYQAPEAELTSPSEFGEMTGPVSVPAGHGWTWIKDGFGHFRQNPWSWMLAFFTLIVFNIVLNLIPMIGLISILISPVIAAGFMIGCRDQEAGKNFTFGHMFKGFQQNMGQLLLVGVVYLVGLVAIGIIISLMVGSTALFMGGGLEAMSSGDPTAMPSTFNPSVLILPMLVGMLLIIPLLMAYWFAPALVTLDGLSALNAMKMSFSGCLKNILPFLVYGVMGFLLSIFAVIIALLLGALLGFAGLPFWLAFLPYVLVLLGIGPAIIASIYTGYRDIYFS